MGVRFGLMALCKNQTDVASAWAGGIVDRGAWQPGGGNELLPAGGNVSSCRGSRGRGPHPEPVAAMAVRRLDCRADTRLRTGVRTVALLAAPESGQHRTALDFGGPGSGTAVISAGDRRFSRGSLAIG